MMLPTLKFKKMLKDIAQIMFMQIKGFLFSFFHCALRVRMCECEFWIFVG